jgi:hypothetical protein
VEHRPERAVAAHVARPPMRLVKRVASVPTREGLQPVADSANVIFQQVGQLRGRIEEFCALHLKLRDFFALLLLKPKSDRISLREGW